MTNDKRTAVYGPLNKEDALFHNTELLLRNYREICWSIKMNEAIINAEVSEEFSMGVGEYLSSLYGAGVTRFDRKIDSQAESLQLSIKMIDLLNKSITFLRENHHNGEEYYKIIYYAFLYETPLSLNQVLASLAKDGFTSNYRTYYRRRAEAIEKLSALLWGAAMRELNIHTR